jgi:hypothetical protein
MPRPDAFVPIADMRPERKPASGLVQRGACEGHSGAVAGDLQGGGIPAQGGDLAAAPRNGRILAGLPDSEADRGRVCDFLKAPRGRRPGGSRSRQGAQAWGNQGHLSRERGWFLQAAGVGLGSPKVT